MEGAGCTHPLSETVADRLPLLDQPQGQPLPSAGAAALRDWEWQFSAIATDAAALWGERDGVAIWIVPVVSRADGGGPCAPADGACVVALPDDGDADANCQAPLKTNIRWAPLAGGRTLVFGFAENGTTGERVVSGNEEAVVPARDGVLGGVLPFRVGSPPVHQPLRDTTPTVAVVDAASGDAAEAMQRRLEAGGYDVREQIVDGVTPQEPTVVWWRDRDHRGDANHLTELIGGDEVRMIDGKAPRPVLEAGGDVVIQVGAGTG
jgi:hypothetical protein